MVEASPFKIYEFYILFRMNLIIGLLIRLLKYAFDKNSDQTHCIKGLKNSK